MSDWPDTWKHALACYTELSGERWVHLREFEELVRRLSTTVKARGLTAVTSHKDLIISPYTRYPDWFNGRHVTLRPKPEGTVVVEVVGRETPDANSSIEIPTRIAFDAVVRAFRSL